MKSLPTRPASGRPSGSPVPCRFFARGLCREGDQCRFAHIPITTATTTPSLPAPTARAVTPQHQQSSTTANLTTTNIAGASAVTLLVSKNPDTRSEVPCRFNLRGSCRNGAACPYSHATPPADVTHVAVTGESSREQHDAQSPDRSEDWVREIRGTVTQFGGGARVVKVSVQGDFSAVRMTMLPPGSSVASVVALLADLGFAVPAQCVRVQTKGDTSHTTPSSSADVRVEDPSFSKRLCDEVAAREKAGARPLFAVVATTPSMPRGANSRRVDCKKVHCSWHRSVRTAWMNFGSYAIAQKVKDKFDAGSYRILNQTVANSTLTGGALGAWSLTKSRNTLPWTVMLTDVPGAARNPDILADIPPAIQPRHIELGRPSYTEDLSSANLRIKSRLLQFGPLSWWEDATEASGGKRAKAQARFLDEEDARKAVAELDGERLPFNDNGKLTAQLVYSIKTKVPDRIYAAVRDQLQTERLSWRERHVAFIPYPPTNGQRVLKLEGENPNEVAAVQNALQAALAGDVAKKDGKPIWSPVFGIRGDISRRLKEIEESLDIVVVRNKRQSRLQLYGPAESRKRAEALLAELVDAKSVSTYTIYLDQAQFVWACRGGFKAIIGALGEGVATPDITSTPKRILITGSAEQYKKALDIVAEQIGAHHRPDPAEAAAAAPETTDGDCAICWTEAENAVRTRCGHVYCSDCFERFCLSAADSGGLTNAGEVLGDDDDGSDGKKGPILCEGDSGTCRAVIGLDELQEHLSSGALEDVLEAAFESHVRRNHEALRHCPTPDCGHVYKAAGGQQQQQLGLTCAGCLGSVCTACHASHPGASCAEYRDALSGHADAFERLKRELGIKDCPGCKTPIQKSDGCDHMTCRACRTHICWKCMKTFKVGHLVYAHMNSEHGSIGI